MRQEAGRWHFGARIRHLSPAGELPHNTEPPGPRRRLRVTRRHRPLHRKLTSDHLLAGAREKGDEPAEQASRYAHPDPQALAHAQVFV
jgi:hypothetical protein